MATNIEYALMAGASYISSRPDENAFPAPIAYGWAEIKSEYVTKPSGFEAVSFQNGNGISDLSSLLDSTLRQFIISHLSIYFSGNNVNIFV